MTDTTTPPGVITVGGLTMTAAQDQIGAALARAQGEVRKARKNAKNPHLRNEYADLSSVLDATRGAMAANGLSLVQAPQRACAGPCSTARASGCPARSSTRRGPLRASDPHRRTGCQLVTLGGTLWRAC